MMIPLRMKKMKRRTATLSDIPGSHLKPDKIVDGYKFFGASRDKMYTCFRCGTEATKRATIHEIDAKGYPYTVIERYCMTCLPYYIILAK